MEKTLAQRMTQDEFRAADSAFAALAGLQKAEELGADLRDEVFDNLLDAGIQCEKARRIVWKHSQRFRDRAERLIRRRFRDFRERRELRKVCGAAIKIRKERERSPTAQPAGS